MNYQALDNETAGVGHLALIWLVLRNDFRSDTFGGENFQKQGMG